MRRIAAVTGALLLAGASLGTAGAAHAATGKGGFSFQGLGGFHLKKTEITTNDTENAFLFCFTTQNGSGPTVIHGIGTVKDAGAACRELANVDGDFSRLAVHPTWLAPAIVAPVVVSARGWWSGKRVDWTHQYTNDGWLVKATGDVFDF